MKEEAAAQVQNSYNAFLPLAIITTALCVMLSMQIYQMLAQRAFLKQNIAKLQPAIQEARVISGTVSQLSRELLLLSSTSAEAKKIVQEFQIRPTGQQPLAPTGGGAVVPPETLQQ